MKMGELKILFTLLAAIIITARAEEQKLQQTARSKKSAFENPIFRSVFHNADSTTSLKQKFVQGTENNESTRKKSYKPKFANPKLFDSYQASRLPVPKPHDVYGIPAGIPHEQYGVPKVSTVHEKLPRLKPFREYLPQSFLILAHAGVPSKVSKITVSNSVDTYGIVNNKDVSTPLPQYGPPVAGKAVLEYGLPRKVQPVPFAKPISQQEATEGIPGNFKPTNPTSYTTRLQQSIEIPFVVPPVQQPLTNTLPKIVVSKHYIDKAPANSPQTPLKSSVLLPYIQASSQADSLQKTEVPEYFFDYKPQEVYGLPKKYIQLGSIEHKSDISWFLPLVSKGILARKQEIYGLTPTKPPSSESI